MMPNAQSPPIISPPLILYTGGSLRSFRKEVGGSSREEGLRLACTEGGEEGGVSRPCPGRGPGEQIGRCLLGIAAGVPLEDVLSVRCGGGVVGRSGIGGGRATTVAIIQSK